MAAYHDDITSEMQWHQQSSAPGKTINRTHPCYYAGRNAYWAGETHCPYAAGTAAAMNWELGWNDAAGSN